MSLDQANLLRGLAVLKSLGYVPKVPVPIDDFADEAKRKSWIDEKHMVVFSLRSELYEETDVDLFVTDPLGFEQAYKRVFLQPLEAETLSLLDRSSSATSSHAESESRIIDVPFCSYEDLIFLKNQAGRHRDRDDIERLRIARGEQ